MSFNNYCQFHHVILDPCFSLSKELGMLKNWLWGREQARLIGLIHWATPFVLPPCAHFAELASALPPTEYNK
jgi:hypothetical protein